MAEYKPQPRDEVELLVEMDEVTGKRATVMYETDEGWAVNFGDGYMTGGLQACDLKLVKRAHAYAAGGDE